LLTAYALYDAEILSISKNKLFNLTISKETRSDFIKEFGKLFYKEMFQKSITRQTSDVFKINNRIDEVNKTVRLYFNVV
jgi:hypothetical protein